MTQSRTMSFVEAAANVIVGYVLAVATQLIAFPLFGLHVGLGANLTIGLLFTAVSLTRSYTLRRLFEKHLGRGHQVNSFPTSEVD